MLKLGFSEIIKRRKQTFRKLNQKKSIDWKNNAILTTSFDEDQIITQILDTFLKQQTQSTQSLHKLTRIMANKSMHKFNINVASDHIKIIKQDHIGIIEKTNRKIIKSYYLLKGKIIIYGLKQQCKRKKTIQYGNLSQIEKAIIGQETQPQKKQEYPSIDSFEIYNPKLVVLSDLLEKEGYGFLFDNENNCGSVLVGINAIVAVIDNSHIQEDLLNLGGISAKDKENLISKFKIFDFLGKNIRSYLPVFSLNKYDMGQNIYKAGNKPKNIYLIIKGQVVLQTNIFNPNKLKPKSEIIQTQTLGSINYFGEEQLLFPSNRLITARCKSVQCWLLELGLDRIEKLAQNNDFKEALLFSARIKINERKKKVEKACEIRGFYRTNSEEKLQIEEDSSGDNQGKNTHGNLIPKSKLTSHKPDPFKFNMLRLNIDMYNATQKKFRRYSIKPSPKYIPDVNWDFKRVWKVLNLENILRSDIDLIPQQGKKFYDCHHRLISQLNQTKSLRPKTSSSSYRTRLKYITYLQQFNS